MTERELFDAIRWNAEVEDLYTGDCKGCGECCSRFLPLSFMDIVRLRGYFASHKVEIRKPVGDFDIMCPFLSEDRECMVYDARPEICRTYRCDLHKAGRVYPFLGIESAEVHDMRVMFGKEER